MQRVFTINLVKIHKLVIEICCLQKLITHMTYTTPTDRQARPST